jgi:hypothetical protein
MKIYQTTTVNTPIDADEAEKILSLKLNLQHVEIIISDHIRERSRVSLNYDINYLEVPKIVDTVIESMGGFNDDKSPNYQITYKFV